MQWAQNTWNSASDIEAPDHEIMLIFLCYTHILFYTNIYFELKLRKTHKWRGQARQKAQQK